MMEDGDTTDTYKNPMEHWQLIEPIIDNALKNAKDMRYLTFRMNGLNEKIVEKIYLKLVRRSHNYVIFKSSFGKRNNLDIMFGFEFKPHSEMRKHIG